MQHSERKKKQLQHHELLSQALYRPHMAQRNGELLNRNLYNWQILNKPECWSALYLQEYSASAVFTRWQWWCEIYCPAEYEDRSDSLLRRAHTCSYSNNEFGTQGQDATWKLLHIHTQREKAHLCCCTQCNIFIMKRNHWQYGIVVLNRESCEINTDPYKFCLTQVVDPAAEK